MASLPGYYDKRKVTSSISPADYSEEAINPRTRYGYLTGYPDMYDTRLVIEPPDEDGNGGRRILLTLHYQYFYEIDYFGDPNLFINKFAEIRDSLRNRFWNFHDLPSPSEFGGELDAAGGAIRSLALDFNVMSTWTTLDVRSLMGG